jgi:hypothetical protein
MTGGERLVAGARRAALALAAEVVGMAGAGAAARAWTAPGPGEAPVPGARARVDGKQDGLDGAGRSPRDVVVAEWTVHDDERRWPAPCVGRRRSLDSEKAKGSGPRVCQSAQVGSTVQPLPATSQLAFGLAALSPFLGGDGTKELGLHCGQALPQSRGHTAAQSRSGEARCAGMVAASLICATLCLPKGSRVCSDAHRTVRWTLLTTSGDGRVIEPRTTRRVRSSRGDACGTMPLRCLDFRRGVRCPMLKDMTGADGAGRC